MTPKKIITIVNFVRSADPREDPDRLFDTFCRQVQQGAEVGLPHTFLLQYDALAKPRYVAALADTPCSVREVGVWIEMAKEQVERCGLTWHGRPGFEWDWHVNPGFLMAYTPAQRKLLIDELMERFHAAFGYYPKSVGSWLLDTWSITYMTEAYGVDAFCFCKEQYGTDGYTLWGGYYNQGYYPSRRNMFLPAQTKEMQIPAPVFRMLGSDPIYQYDSGQSETLEPGTQPVLSLEPCWGCGQDPAWVNWFLGCNFDEECLSFAFTQTGQENSFDWAEIGKGMAVQLPEIRNGVAAGRFEVLSLGDTGRWFKATYETTPATALTALTDWQGQGRQSVWYNSKRYRANVARRDGAVYLRDLHLFEETYAERYLTEIELSDAAVYDTLPLVDGFRWSGGGVACGWYLTRPDGTRCEAEITAVTADGVDTLVVSLVADGEPVTLRCEEERLTWQGLGNRCLRMQWHSLRDTESLTVAAEAVTYVHGGMTYGMQANGGSFRREDGLWLSPAADAVTLSFFVKK